MTTRDILDYQGNVTGELTLSDDTTEDQWAAALAQYALPPANAAAPDPLAGQLSKMAFGRTLIATFSAQNSALNYPVAVVESLLVALGPIKNALETGSLDTAIYLLNNLTPDGVYITVAKVTAFRNMLEDYLQIPRT